MHDFDWVAVQDRYDATLLANVESFIDSLASAEQLYDYVSNLDASNGNTGQPVFYAGIDFGIQSDGLANAGFQMLDQSQAQAFLDISRNIIYDRLRNTGADQYNTGGQYSLYGTGDTSLIAAASRTAARCWHGGCQIAWTPHSALRR